MLSDQSSVNIDQHFEVAANLWMVVKKKKKSKLRVKCNSILMHIALEGGSVQGG